MRKRSGFTIFDLLLILAILAILIGLLLPAIQKVREAAARMESANNLKQIGLGCHSYHDVYNNMPPFKGKKDASVLVTLLPFVEQANLYDQFQNNGLKAVKGVRMKIYVSPRDPLARAAKGSYTSYLFNAGTEHSLVKNNGVFAYQLKVKLQAIPDGTSNTIMAAETLVGGPAENKMNTVFRQHVSLDKNALKKLTAKSGMDKFQKGKNIASDRGHRWYDPKFLQTAFTMTRKLNDTRPDVNCGGEGGLSGLRSRDRRTNVLICDGSVHFLRDNVSFKTLQALSTRNGGEVVGNF